MGYKAFDLQTDNLGIVKVGHLTVKALTELSPNLDPMIDTDDATLVRALMVAVSKTHSDVQDESGRKLTDGELQLITDADLERFAVAFMEQERWEADKDEYGQLLPPVQALAKAFRFQVEQMGASTRKMMEGLQGIISPATQKLFMMNTALSERLKELGGIKPVFSTTLMDAMKGLQSPMFDAAKMRFSLGNTSAASLIKNFEAGQEIAQAAKIISPEQVEPPHIDIRALTENSTANRSARAVTELNHKAEEIVEIARGMAVAHGNTNEMVSQAMAQFEIKRISDTDDIKKSLVIASGNLRIAIYSLIASVILGAISLWYAYGSYHIAKEADITSNEQTQALKDLVAIQREGNAKLQAKIDYLEADAARKAVKQKLKINNQQTNSHMGKPGKD